MKANTPLAYSDLKIYLVPTHVTKISITNLFQVQKLNFVLLEITRYFGEIPIPFRKSAGKQILVDSYQSGKGKYLPNYEILLRLLSFGLNHNKKG